MWVKRNEWEQLQRNCDEWRLMAIKRGEKLSKIEKEAEDIEKVISQHKEERDKYAIRLSELRALWGDLLLEIQNFNEETIK